MDALEYASFVNYHLALLKIQDGSEDNKGIKGFVYKIFLKLMSSNKKYMHLKRKYTEVSFHTELLCKTLYQLEANTCNEYDLCSATMGQLLSVIMKSYLNNHPVENPTPVVAFATHLGMWTYLIDAYDDFECDRKAKRFNPLNSFDSLNTSTGCIEFNLAAGEMMLSMMVENLSLFLKEIKIYRHTEVLENIVNYGTKKAMIDIKRKREKHGCSAKRN